MLFYEFALADDLPPRTALLSRHISLHPRNFHNKLITLLSLCLHYYNSWHKMSQRNSWVKEIKSQKVFFFNLLTLWDSCWLRCIVSENVNILEVSFVLTVFTILNPNERDSFHLDFCILPHLNVSSCNISDFYLHFPVFHLSVLQIFSFIFYWFCFIFHWKFRHFHTVLMMWHITFSSAHAEFAHQLSELSKPTQSDKQDVGNHMT